MSRRLLPAPVVVLLCLFAGVAPAGAAFSAPISGTNTLAAGTHPDVTMTIQFPDTGAKVQDMDLKLPPGLLGDPNVVTRCTLTEVANTACPDSAKVGQVYVTADIWLPEVLGGITLPNMPIAGSVYMMQPRGQETARLYTQLGPYVDGTHSMVPIKMETPIRLNSPGDYGLITEMRELPRSNTIYPFGWTWAPTTGYTQLKSMSMTLYGLRDNMSAPFMTAPTSCSPIRYSVSARAYGSTKWVSNQSSAINMTGCDSPPFTPVPMTVSPTSFTADQPTGVTVTMGFPAPDGGTAQSAVKSAEFKLPEGFALSASSGHGLEACSDEVFAASVAAKPDCPAGSEVGTVAFDTPLVGVATGNVYVGNSAPGQPLRTLIHAQIGAIHLKLSSRVVTDPVTGQITTIFDDIPPIPFTSFTMNFRGGDNAMIKAPSTCGTQDATARMEPAARPGTYSALSAELATTGCPAAQFAPGLETAFSTLQAGADTAMSMAFTRVDSDERFSAMKVSLPAGLLGRLTAVARCSIGAARANACQESAKVGTVGVSAGTGNTPFGIVGNVYLTEPEPGAVAGLAITVPAKVGPIDLGSTVVMAKMTVRPDLGIDVTTEAMPQILGGVPLFIRGMTLNLDRQGFLFNASSCAPGAISADISSVAGNAVTRSAPYAPGGCEALPFAPNFVASLSGDLNKPALHVTMRPRAGDSTISSMRMTLPSPLGADPNKLGDTCAEAAFLAGRCPAKSKIGDAVAVSPIIPDPLSGPVYLAQLPGEPLPGLAVSLHGLIDMPITIVNDISRVGGSNLLSSTVRGIPDVPLTSFDLQLNAGSLLAADRKALCSKPQTITAAFTGHSGGSAKTTPALKYNCSAKTTNAPLPRVTASGSIRVSGKRAGLKLKVRGKQIKSVKITAPKSYLKISPKRVRGAALTKSGSTLISRSLVTARGQAVTIKLPAKKRKKGVSALSIDIAKQAIGRGKKLRRGKVVKVKVRVSFTTGRAKTLTVKIKAR